MKKFLHDHDAQGLIRRHRWIARFTWFLSVLLYAVLFGMLAQILSNEAKIDRNQETIIHNQRVNTCLIRNGNDCGTPQVYR